MNICLYIFALVSIAWLSSWHSISSMKPKQRLACADNKDTLQKVKHIFCHVDFLVGFFFLVYSITVMNVRVIFDEDLSINVHTEHTSFTFITLPEKWTSQWREMKTSMSQVPLRRSSLIQVHCWFTCSFHHVVQRSDFTWLERKARSVCWVSVYLWRMCHVPSPPSLSKLRSAHMCQEHKHYVYNPKENNNQIKCNLMVYIKTLHSIFNRVKCQHTIFAIIRR